MPFTIGDALEGTSRAGYRYIDLTCSPGHCEHAPLGMDPAQFEAFQSNLERHNLKVSSLNAHTGLMSKEGIEQAKQTIDLAVKLGAEGVVNSIAGAHSHDEDLSQFMNHVGEAGDYARDHGVMIGIEVHGNYTGNGKDSLAVIREVNHPHVKIAYDTANCVYYGDTWPYEDLEMALPEIAFIHLKDKIGGKGVWNFPPVGSGDVDFKRVLKILDDGGYTGPLSIEMEFDDKGWPPLETVHEAVASTYRYLMPLLEAHW